ncbi:AraC family transcriptional regulator [Herbaspirillum sp. AP02]|uniref:AraC family transcriptional regulator n=1 Tax=unclassified Herbaspirillum TaxID=2624150 RepID=UPI0018CACB47|nr:AraC family transcriptional regulator [Herbaspirillum sp. AP02]MBG7617999.1 AraC family transcriptional regulator [Herbaspirillum sp. AP02]
MSDSIDPLAEVVTLLQPAARYTKYVQGAGGWRVRRSRSDLAFYCTVIEGSCRILRDDGDDIVLEAGDFVLAPALEGFTLSSMQDSDTALLDEDNPPPRLADGRYHLGSLDLAPAVQLVVGHCVFDSPDTPLLLSLLPDLVVVRAHARLTTLAQLVGEEFRAARPAREMVLARLLEVLLIEALRSTSEAGAAPTPGLLRGLADARLAQAIRALHARPAEHWNVVMLAREAALSRSSFFERFRREVGLAPMEYLLAWRMALAKRLLLRADAGMSEVAQQVGYSSASTFSVAFTRHVGVPPSQFSLSAQPG